MNPNYTHLRIILVCGFLIGWQSLYSQCTNTSKYPPAAINAPPIGVTTQIALCNWAGEYAEISNVASSTTYRILTNISGDYITIRKTTPNGPVVTHGLAPLDWTSTTAGSYYVHFNANASCATNTSCRQTNIEGLMPAGPMVFQSAAVTQSNTLGAPICGTNQEIIRIEVVTSGTTSPISMTNFVVRTEGSTSPAISNSNVSNIDLYYSGSDAAFAATTLFASAPPQPSTGDINFSGSQTLGSGSNYFWVVYDMNPSSAILGNVVDARLNQITVDGFNYNIVAGAPAGSRTIVGCTSSPGGVELNNTLWLNSGNAADIIVDGSNRVSSWHSPVASTLNLSQSTVNKRPTYYSASPDFNFNSHIKFDGINDDLKNTSAINLLGTSGTVIIASSNEPGSGGGSALTYKETGSNTHYQIKPYFNCGFSQGSSTTWQATWAAATTTSTPISRPQMFGLRGGNSAFNYRNGIYNTSPHIDYAGAIVSGGLTLGSNNSTGEWCGSGMAEVILYDRSLSTSELNRIQSYLAVKYGVTMGLNGTSTNYFSADGSVIWDVASNAGYNYDIAGIGRDDIGAMDQRKSHSINGPSNSTYSDILTVVNGNNFNFPTNFSNNASYFMWGHNNFLSQGDYMVDVEAPVITRFMRVWKGQETGNVGVVTLEFDMSNVPGDPLPGTNDLSEVRLLVDADGTFASGATLISPSYYDNITNIVQFTHNFNAGSGYFFTIGSVNFSVSPLPVSLSEFTAQCSVDNVVLEWTTQSETNNAFFTLEKSEDARNFKPVATINGNGNSTSNIKYSWTDYSGTSDITYYRLKQTDFDGAHKYYDVVSIACISRSIPLTLYPNPTKDKIFIENYNAHNLEYKLEIYTILGEIIERHIIAGSTWITLPEPSGIYFFKIKNGNNTYIEKVIKN